MATCNIYKKKVQAPRVAPLALTGASYKAGVTGIGVWACFLGESPRSVTWPAHATSFPRIVDMACAGDEGSCVFVVGSTRIDDKAPLPRIGEVAHCLVGCWACGLLDFGAYGLLVGWTGGLGHQGTPAQA